MDDTKIAWFYSFNVLAFMFFTYLFAFIYNIFYNKFFTNNIELKINNDEIKYGICIWILIFFEFLFAVLALREWKYAIVSLINSLGMFIPIFLSRIILKEKISFLQIIVFVLFLIMITIIYLWN